MPHIWNEKTSKSAVQFLLTTCQNVRRNLLAQFHVHKIRKKRRRPLTKKTATIWAETVLLLLLLPSWKTLLKRIFEIFFMFTSLSCLVRWPFFQQNWVIVLIRQIFTFSGHLSLVSYRVNILTKVDRLRIHRSKLFEFLLNLCSGPNPTICRDTWSTLPKAFFCLRRIALVHFQAHGHDFTENG